MTSPLTSVTSGDAPQARAVWRAHLQVALCLLIAALVPFVGIYPVFVMKAMCIALLASSFNLLFGYAGLLSFGHAAFFGTAAYVTGYAMKFLGTTPEVAIALGTACATMLGVMVGWLAIRRQGVYFAMITLALAQLLFFFYVQASWFSGGEDGIQAIPRGKLLGILAMDNPLVLYYAVLAICGGGLALIARIVHSPFGRLLKAVRENEARVVSLGYRVDAAKLLAFALSASLAGLAGATKTIVLQLATLSDVSWSLSGEIVLMTLLGGLGTLWGPVIGALLLVGIDTYLASLGPLLSTLQGFVFMLCVMYCPQGIWGWLGALRFDRMPMAYSSQADAAASPSGHR